MTNAGRDPILWAALAIAEQDFDGSGDLCIRCHSTGGWYGDRATPTDGSGLAASDADGVDCDSCHKMTNPDGSEHPGVMNPPFIANDEGTPAVGYYGTGMLSLSGGNAKLGPYSDADARHQFLQSSFHRDVDFCGSCHDVSNPAVGDLAHNNGAQPTADPVIASGIPDSPLDTKAAFNNFPYLFRQRAGVRHALLPGPRLPQRRRPVLGLQQRGRRHDRALLGRVPAADRAPCSLMRANDQGWTAIARRWPNAPSMSSMPVNWKRTRCGNSHAGCTHLGASSLPKSWAGVVPWQQPWRSRR